MKINITIFILLILTIVFFGCLLLQNNETEKEAETLIDKHKKEIDSLQTENAKLITSIDSLNNIAVSLQARRVKIKSNYEKKYTEIDSANSDELVIHFGSVFSKNNIR